MKQAFFYESPLGKIGLAEENGTITNLFFQGTVAPESYETTETPLLREAARQLAEYFLGSRREFQLPMAPAGTPFQLDIWNGLLTIPYGETRTYGELARQLERPKAARAVGFANSRNPISILVPCHRVIGAGGGLTGYAGGLESKKFLLALEGIL